MINVTSSPPYPPSPVSGKRYLAALILVANTISIPILAALITAAIYISPSILNPPMPVWPFNGQVGWVIVLTGLISTLIIWLLVAALCRNSTTFEHVDVLSASSLKRKREILQARYTILREQYPPQSLLVLRSEHEEMALREIEAGLKGFDCMIEREEPIWVLSTGYISAWGQLHDVEEAMMDILPCETLLNEAAYDQLCLEGSDIPNSDPKDAKSDTVLGLLETAIQTLSAPQASPPVASPHEEPSKTALGLLQRALQMQTLLGLSKNAIEALSPRHPASHPAEQISDQQARADLRKIRCAINKFNDERWAGLVRTRKLLMLTAVLGGVFTYILLFIAVLGQAAFTSIIAATVFWAVGAVTGIFNQLINDWTSKTDDQTVDDYGLTRARKIVTPILSGLAAIVGVLVAALLSLTLLKPSGQGSVVSGLDSLGKIYDLSNNSQGLIFAAIFGWGPSYLVGILKQQADNLKSQIKNSSPTNQGNSSTSSAS